MANLSRNSALVQTPPSASPFQGLAPSPENRTPVTRGIDLSLPASIQTELEPALAQLGFTLERKDTNPLGHDNIRFHRICGMSRSGPGSAALFYFDDERMNLPGCTEACFIYSACSRVCKEFKTGAPDTLSLLFLTPEGTRCPPVWEEQIENFKGIRAVATAECVSIPAPEAWANADIAVATHYAGKWIRMVELNPLRAAARDLRPALGLTTTSTFESGSIGQEDPGAPHVFISYARKDSGPCDELCTALKGLERLGYRIWRDNRDIPTGDYFESAIANALGGAKVVVMLASQSFIASDFIIEHEVTPTLEAVRKQQKSLVWVKWEPCAADSIGLEKRQAGHEIEPPLVSLDSDSRKAQLNKVYEKIREILEKGRRSQKPPAQQSDRELFGQG